MGLILNKGMIFKSLKRLGLVAWNTAYNLIIPISSLFISILIIRFTSEVLWGEIISYLIVIVAVNQLASWGHKEFLLKLFSKKPAEIAKYWQQNVFTRGGIALASPIAFWFLFPEVAVWQSISMVAIAIFLYRTFDPITIFYKRFRAALGIEIIGLLVIVGGIMIFRHTLSAPLYLRLLACSYLVRTLFFAFLYRRELFPKVYFALNVEQLRQALPFLLLTFIGLLENQLNTYAIAFLRDNGELGKFQVLFALFLFVKNGAFFIIQPFQKNLLRASANTYQKISIKLFLLGILLSTIACIMLAYFIPLVYDFDFRVEIYGLGVLYAIPSFYFAAKSVQLVRLNLERWLVFIGVANVFTNLVLCLWLIPIWGIKGAMIATCCGQWVILLMYLLIFTFRKATPD